MTESFVYSKQELSIRASYIVSLLSVNRVVTFTGDLGAGKTALVKEILKQSGIDEMVQSPTYSYVNIYVHSNGDTYYHFDLYRMSSLDDFYMAGFDEYLSVPNSYCFIEWPALIDSLLPDNTLRIHSAYKGADAREITLTY